MTNFCKYDVVVIKFPFASSLRYKARPAVVLSSNVYNKSKRHTLLIMAISSKIDSPFEFETLVTDWQDAGLLKPSIFKASIATIEQEFVVTKLGSLSNSDIKELQAIVQNIC